jgi:hypothetical protein
MFLLHLHPRATELFAVTSGHILTEMVPEAAVLDADGKQRVIRTDLHAGAMTVFPQGSFHTQLNPECEPASVAASFTSEDPGTGVIVSETLALSDDVVLASFGGAIDPADLEAIRNAIPQSASISLEECRKKCGI